MSFIFNILSISKPFLSFKNSMRFSKFIWFFYFSLRFIPIQSLQRVQFFRLFLINFKNIPKFTPGLWLIWLFIPPKLLPFVSIMVLLIGGFPSSGIFERFGYLISLSLITLIVFIYIGLISSFLLLSWGTYDLSAKTLTLLLLSWVRV